MNVRLKEYHNQSNKCEIDRLRVVSILWSSVLIGFTLTLFAFRIEPNIYNMWNLNPINAKSFAST